MTIEGNPIPGFGSRRLPTKTTRSFPCNVRAAIIKAEATTRAARSAVILSRARPIEAKPVAGRFRLCLFWRKRENARLCGYNVTIRSETG